MSFGPPSTDIVSGGGIAAGTPFTLGQIPVVTQAIPPVVADSLLRQTTDTASIASGIVVGPNDTPYGSGVKIAETFRTLGGFISSSGLSSYATKIGRGAAFSANSDQGNTLANFSGIVIGAQSTGYANQGVLIGSNSTLTGQGDVLIGYGSYAAGNGNGSVVVGLGSSAYGGIGVAVGSGNTAQGYSIAVGYGNTPSQAGIAIGGNISCFNQAIVIDPGHTTNSTNGLGDIAIGSDTRTYGNQFSYESNVAIGYQAGSRASGTARYNVHVGAGAQSVTNANQRLNTIIGGNATTAFSAAVLVGYGLSALSSGEIVLGVNDTTYGPSTVLRLGGPDTDTVTRNFAIRFINASGTNVAGGTLTIIAPLGTGNSSNSDMIFQTGLGGSSGSLLQSAGDRLRIRGGITNTHVRVIGPSATGDAYVGFWPNGGAAELAIVGAPGNPGNLVTGSAVGDLVLRTASKVITLSNDGGTTIHAQADSGSGADSTPLLLYDVSAGTLKRVSRGAVDSGGAGFRLLRIPN